MTSRRSPVKAVGKPLLFGFKSIQWTPRAGFRGAQFSSRKRKHHYAIVHPSTKTAGKWQVSYFDELGPVSDTQHANADDALRQVPATQWRLRDF